VVKAYGLAIDSYQHAVSLLDALALERAVDARVDASPPAHKAAPPYHAIQTAGRWQQVATDWPGFRGLRAGTICP